MTNMSRIRALVTNRRTLRTCGTVGCRVGLLLVALLLSVATGESSEGDRATAGQCPQDEVCSDHTPEGLHFEGPDFTDDGLFADQYVGITAVGGVQKIEIVDPGERYIPYFDAECRGTALVVTRFHPPFVTVRADSTGTSYLRILEPHGNALYDRLGIESLPVEHVRVFSWVPGSLLTKWEHQSTRLYYGGMPIRWYARLENGGRRLVDQSLVFSAEDASGAPDISSTRWDQADILPASDATRLEVTVTTGSGATGIGQVQVTHEIDRFEWVEGEELPETIEVSQGLNAGIMGLTADDRQVHGLDWSVTAIAPNGTISEWVFIWFGQLVGSFDQVGVWQLEISAANVTEVFEITATPPAP